MSRLDNPESWAQIALDDACDLITCGVAAKPNYVDSGIPFLSAKNVQEEKVFWEGFKYINRETHQKLSKHNKPCKGDILYTRVGSYGEAAIIDREDEFSIFVSLTLLKPKPDLVVNTFLKNWLNSGSVKSLAKKSITGVGVGNLNVGAVRKFIMPLPPIPEQKRIVEKIESTKSKINEIESYTLRAEELIKKYREALLQKAFRGELIQQKFSDESASELLELIRSNRSKQSENRKRNNDELSPIKPEEIPFEIPKSWLWVRLSDLGELARGKSKHRPRNDKKLFGGKYPFIQTGDVARCESGLIQTFNQTYSEFGLAQSRLFRKGTLCITIAANIADVGILDFDSCFPDSIVGFSPALDEEGSKMLSRYVLHYIEMTKSSINRSAKGAAQKNINLEFLDSLLVPLPPLKQIAEIFKALNHAFESIKSFAALNGKINKAISEMGSSILDFGFSGRLVSQDISEGTGHELLSQIRKNESKISDKKLVSSVNKKSKRDRK